MQTEETKDKGDTAKDTDIGCGPMKQMMFEKISKCCTGQSAGFPDCSAMMKSMMKAKTNQSCCTSKAENTELGKEK